MLSRNDYQGKLPYDTYVKRYKMHQEAVFPKSKTDTTPTKPGTDIPPTQEEIKKYLEENKQNLNDKTKELIKQQIEKKTGGKFKDLEDALSKLQGETGDTEEDKEHRDHMLKGFQLARALQPNTETLTGKEIVRAKLAQASKLGYMNDDNFDTAQQYLQSMNDTNAYKIDKNLSTPEGIVVRTPGGTTEIHYRGSQILDKPSLSDMKTNFKIATGFESEDAQFIQAKQQYQNAVNKYGSVEHFGGFSKGGGKALYMGQKYDVPSTTFNPFIGTKTARGITSTTQEHTIIRTTGDSPSLALAVSSNANHENWNVKSVRPLKKNVSLNPIKNMYDAHRLDNLTTPRNSGNVSNDPTAIEGLMFNQMKLMGHRAKYETLHDIGLAVESGKTYSDFVKDLQNAGLRGDNDIGLENGKNMIRGDRHQRGSMDATVDFWELMGGKFSPEEEAVISGKKQQVAVEQTKTGNTLQSLQQEVLNQTQTKPKEKIDQMLDDTDDTTDLIEQLNKQIKDIQGETGITDEDIKPSMISEKEFQENVDKLGISPPRKKGASPPREIEDIEPELNKFINRSQLDIKLTPEELRIREKQEDQFAKIEGDKKKPATSTDNDFETLDDFEALNNKKREELKLTKEQLKEFGNASPQERLNIMDNHNEEIINNTHELGEAMAPVEASGFREHFGEAINPVSMGAGILVGFGTDAVLDYLDSAENPDGTKRKQSITGVGREALSGSITGGLISAGTTALGGTSVGLAPEIAAGAAGYVAGSETGKLVSSGIKKIGGNEDEQALGADTIGGAVGGAAAAGTLIGGAALTGAEIGSAGGPMGIAIGAGVGLLGGTLGFGISEIVKHKDDIKKGFVNAGNAVANVAKSTGNFFKNLF